MRILQGWITKAEKINGPVPLPKEPRSEQLEQLLVVTRRARRKSYRRPGRASAAGLVRATGLGTLQPHPYKMEMRMRMERKMRMRMKKKRGLRKDMLLVPRENSLQLFGLISRN